MSQKTPLLLANQYCYLEMKPKTPEPNLKKKLITYGNIIDLV